MLRTVYEMDIEHDRRQAVKKGLQQGRQQGLEQGREQGVNDERRNLVCDLISSGQSANEVIEFLTTVRRMPAAEAKKYYQQAVEMLKRQGRTDD